MTRVLTKPFGTVSRLCGRLRRAYVLACAREDCRQHGLRVPSGMWHCAPCGQTFLDERAYAQHALVDA